MGEKKGKRRQQNMYNFIMFSQQTCQQRMNYRFLFFSVCIVKQMLELPQFATFSTADSASVTRRLKTVCLSSPISWASQHIPSTNTKLFVSMACLAVPLHCIFFSWQHYIQEKVCLIYETGRSWRQSWIMMVASELFCYEWGTNVPT